MNTQMTLERLPQEILELILSDVSIGPGDLIRCSYVSKQLRQASLRNSVWKSKFRQQYPTLYRHYGHSDQWRAKFVVVHRLKKELVKNVLALSQTFVWSMYHDYEWPDIPRRALALYETMFDEEIGDNLGKYFVLDECYSMFRSYPAHKELTLKYYAEKVYRHISHTYITMPEWEKFLGLADEVGAYEEGLVMIAQSVQPVSRVYAHCVKAGLDRIAHIVKRTVKQKHPDHPLNLRDGLVMVVEESAWGCDDCTAVTKCVHQVLRHQMNFITDGTFDYEPNKYCIDKVLETKKGSSKILLVLESCLARRLGVVSEVHMSQTNRILDTWKLRIIGSDSASSMQDCSELEEDTTSVTYVLSNWQSGKKLTARAMCEEILRQLVFLVECRLRGEWWQAGEPVLHDLLAEDTYQHPIRSLFNSWKHVEHWKVSQLRHYLCQLSKASMASSPVEGKLLHLNILLRINSKLTLFRLTELRRQLVQTPSTLRDLLRMVASVNMRARARVADLKSLLGSGGGTVSLSPLSAGPWPHGWPGGEMVQKRRLDRKSSLVYYAVGQVLEHRGSGLCVVYDWDSMCVESDDTLVVMGETNLTHGMDQPFYRVLTSDGAARYLAQENLRQAHKPVPFSNPLLGRYFTAFIYPHYIPNPQKAYEYPEDANIREQDALALHLL
ncbi:F-box only protein 21-like [Oratosquilla oratoria]|uniref:F-box only protein 21-like n=1 Tax=Oratosquilla oratoria TaxID=337810 RepID=UPI003F777AA9